MHKLWEKSIRKVNSVSLAFKRSLTDAIKWEHRMIGIRGARGVGKTTMLLQYIKENCPLDRSTIYLSLDDIYFSSNSLSDFTDGFVKNGGKYLFVDEVHKYATWSTELKNIYDDHSDLKIVFTGSSILPLIQSKADLSRRAVMYDMAGLSLREYINLDQKLSFPKIELEELLKNHLEYSIEINQKIRPIATLNAYNQIGHYPYFIASGTEYHQLLTETITQTIEADIPMYLDLKVDSIEKMKKLLYVISTAVPFSPNIQKISEKTGIGRNLLKQMLHYLDRANIINLLFSDAKGISLLQKPDKVYMKHPNLMYALAADRVNEGSLRETFFLNQVGEQARTEYTKQGDFLVNGKYTFEIGGKNKSSKQIADVENAFVVADDIEYGIGNKIPLYLFGFLY